MQTIFYHKDGRPSSVRTTFGSGSNKTSFTDYIGRDGGGVTTKTGNFTSRFNQQGQCIGTGLKTGGDTTYFGKNGNVAKHITAFE